MTRSDLDVLSQLRRSEYALPSANFWQIISLTDLQLTRLRHFTSDMLGVKPLSHHVVTPCLKLNVRDYDRRLGQWVNNYILRFLWCVINHLWPKFSQPLLAKTDPVINIVYMYNKSLCSNVKLCSSSFCVVCLIYLVISPRIASHALGDYMIVHCQWSTLKDMA